MQPSSLILSVADVANTPIDVTRFIGDKTGASSTIAHLIMKVVDWLLGILGLEHNQTLVTVMYASVVLAIALVTGYIAQIIIFHICRIIAKKWNSRVYLILHHQLFFTKICRVIPPLVFLILIQFTLSNHNGLSGTFTKLTLIWVSVVMAVAVNAFVTSAWQYINERENKRKLPLRGLCELIKGIVWIIAFIIIICVIFDKSPAALLAGIGAFAAVLMLIFKDSILGLVAGVQLAQNDTLHEGDWIKVDSAGANGTVQEVTLTSVKVLNWDKSTTTLPPYSLVSGSFTNFRTMQVSNTRRICRSYMIDADSVLPATPEMLENIKKVPFMNDYITKKLQQKADGHVADVDNPDGLVDGTIDTNLGLFRAYFKMWLDANPHISHDDFCFVSTLEQTATGIPFQVYCFTNTSGWFAYEAIQDSVFEQLAAMLRYFQLYTFENPSGRDTIVDGYLSPGGDIADVFGVPYPFFQSPDAPDSPLSTMTREQPIIKNAASPYAKKPDKPAS